MSNKLSCKPLPQPPASNNFVLAIILPILLCLLVFGKGAAADNLPDWMRSLVGVPLPPHDEKTDAVLLYSEENVTVVSADKVRTQVRKAYKILRPSGRDYGIVVVTFNPQRKVNHLRGWCIPAQGNIYEVKDKEAVEVSLPKIEGAQLISDVKAKVIEIPAPNVGNIVGYEYETEAQPLVLQEGWNFQGEIPARESRFSLQLPAGWEYKAAWLNYPEVKATQSGSNQWQWTLSGVKANRDEPDMAPVKGMAGQMIVSFFPTGGSASNGFSNWQQMGTWYANLTSGRSDASPEIKQKVTLLTASEKNPLDKMRAIAQFMQHDIRYVAIELGVGGLQPHPAGEVFVHRYGDCKDKATLMASMLHEIGVDSYYVVINGERGIVTSQTPAYLGAFDHVILAVKLPDGANNPLLIATWQDPRLGKLLFFDPTDELTPFGQITGDLQENYGLLVAPAGGELVELPALPPTSNGIHRTAKFSLDATGKLSGSIEEERVGDAARQERQALRKATTSADFIKRVESHLAASLSTFRVPSVKVTNLNLSGLPFGYDYPLVAENYAQNAGALLLVRPRVLGVKAPGFLETKEPRKYPIEFFAPTRDTDTFEITLPAGYEVDELPPPVDADYGFATYHSKTEVSGSVIRYTRTFEIRELSVPVGKAEEVKKFNRIITSDERNVAVLKPLTK
jgi:hypothetical protein